jgi:type I restriction enzyme, R subunit
MTAPWKPLNASLATLIAGLLNRFLVCADKFQTGYDEPLLHTMYVDKPLSGIKAVQTLSRLNRAHPQKYDVCVLDFQNDTDTIAAAFADYYRTTILSEETDPNKLHDLKSALDGYQVYASAQMNDLVMLYLGGADRNQLDPILDACVAVYNEELDEDGQVDFKGKAKAFIRTYGFQPLSCPTPMQTGKSCPFSLIFSCPSCQRRRRRTSRRASLKPSTWTATGSRRRQQ